MLYGLDPLSEPSRDGRTAGDLMLTDVPIAERSQTVGKCRSRLRESSFADASGIAVVDGRRLVGLIGAARLLQADEAATVSALIEPGCEPVSPETPIETAAHRMVHRADPAVAVADREGRFLGLVPAARVTEVLLLEHDEDLARIGGYRSSARRARHAAEEPLARRLWHRLPWLIVGLAGAMASALLVGAFEEQLDDLVLLAFFVPAVVYMADSVGTQTETLLIRALAADVRLGKVIKRELLTGVLLGAAVALLFYPFALIGWDNGDVALGVSLALLCSCSISTAIAMTLPIALRGLGFDPAFGSGPLATVLQDLLSIAIYFAIAVPLAT
jgi:magnesium transporter